MTRKEQELALQKRHDEYQVRSKRLDNPEWVAKMTEDEKQSELHYRMVEYHALSDLEEVLNVRGRTYRLSHFPSSRESIYKQEYQRRHPNEEIKEIEFRMTGGRIYYMNEDDFVMEKFKKREEEHIQYEEYVEKNTNRMTDEEREDAYDYLQNEFYVLHDLEYKLGIKNRKYVINDTSDSDTFYSDEHEMLIYDETLARLETSNEKLKKELLFTQELNQKLQKEIDEWRSQEVSKVVP